LQFPSSPQLVAGVAVQLVAQQICLEGSVSSVTQALPVPHSALVAQATPRPLAVQTIDTQLIETQSAFPRQCLVSGQGWQAARVGPPSGST
jgi:hypothetical protein